MKAEVSTLSWLSMGKYFARDGSVDVDVMD